MALISRRTFIETAALAGVGTVAWSGSLAGQPYLPPMGVSRGLAEAAALKAAGYDFIEGNVGTALVPDKPEADFEAMLAQVKALALPLPALNVFIPGALKLVGPDANHDGAAAYAETALRRARAAGIGIIVFGSGGARKIPDGFDPARAREQFITFVKRIAPAAQAAGVTLALEPLNKKETNFINTVTEGTAVVDIVGHPAFRLHADVYHMLQEDEAPDAIRAAASRIVHVHVAQKGTRLAPMPGGTDFTAYFKALKAVNYRGRVSIEGTWKEGETDYATASRYLREQWAAA
jgi:sugar phosphate isomerase/epimerase